MAFTQFVTVKGKVKWFRHNNLNEWGKWSHRMYPDAESLDKLRELQADGVKNQIKKDDDGWYVNLSRPAEINVKGRKVGMKQPEVFDGSQTLADGSHPPMYETNVGDGSDVVTKLEVYEHATPGGGKAKAARWLSSRVDNLVPYSGGKERSEDELRAAKGMSVTETPPAELW